MAPSNFAKTPEKWQDPQEWAPLTGFRSKWGTRTHPGSLHQSSFNHCHDTTERTDLRRECACSRHSFHGLRSVSRYTHCFGSQVGVPGGTPEKTTPLMTKKRKGTQSHNPLWRNTCLQWPKGLPLRSPLLKGPQYLPTAEH